MEDYAYILDYLPNGRTDARGHAQREPTAFAVGESQFTLLELIPKPGAQIATGERVYIGKDTEKRQKISKVRGRIDHTQLSATAQAELPYVLVEIVKANPDQFLKFFNESNPLSRRLHSLELLPGLGKKTMQSIIDERKKGAFQSFEDLQKRVHALHTPDKLVAHRIELELSDPHQKYHLFTRPPVPSEDNYV